jgi:hypothetical protein
MKINENGELLCPKCHEGYLHQREVYVYFREEEDSVLGTSVNVTKEAVYTTRHQTGNPSTRRDGFTATFMCELCHGYVKLCFAQHKGHTNVYWNK